MQFLCVSATYSAKDLHGWHCSARSLNLWEYVIQATPPFPAEKSPAVTGQTLGRLQSRKWWSFLTSCLFVCDVTAPSWPGPPLSRGFYEITHNDAPVGRTPLDEWSARRIDLYMTTHNTHNRQTSMPPVWFEPTISAGERPQTYALDRVAIGTGFLTS
jgi:hypothetical protein